MGTLNKNANLYTKNGRLVVRSEQLKKNGVVVNPFNSNRGGNRHERRAQFAKMKKTW